MTVTSTPIGLGVRSRGFRFFWLARGASQFGDEISVLALPWLVAQATASPFAVGLLEALAFAPIFVLGLPLGAMADRRSRKRSMVESDLARLALVGSIPLAAYASFGTSLGHVFAVVVAAGAFRILFEASSQAVLPDLVHAQEIVHANARLGLTEGLAAVSGPAVAGLLIATAGTQGAILADALTFGISGCAIALVAIPRERYQAGAERFGTAVREGLSAVRRGPHLRALTLVGGAANVGAGMAIGMSVIFFQKTLELEGWQAGMVYASNGVGGIAGSVICVRVIRIVGMARSVLLGLALTAAGVLLLGVTTTSTWFATATSGDAVVGFGIAIAVVASASLRQHMVRTRLLGRVTATYRLVVNGALAVGALVGGALGELVGIRFAILIACASMFVVIAIGLATPLNGPDPPAAEPASPGE
jgi:MFS family permease